MNVNAGFVPRVKPVTVMHRARNPKFPVRGPTDTAPRPHLRPRSRHSNSILSIRKWDNFLVAPRPHPIKRERN